MTTLIETEIVELASLASAVMNEHINDQGLCPICGLAWPCDRVVLAEHNLAVCG